jgi:hypothetical protein
VTDDGNQPNQAEVFVVHGRNEQIRKSMFEFLRALHLKPMEWNRMVELTGKGSPYVGEILDQAFEKAAAVVVLLTGDDEARLKEAYRADGEEHEATLMPQARPNVLFEAGMAISRSQERTILVQVGALRDFSDIAGRHIIRLDNSAKARAALIRRLRTAHCPVDDSGTDWLDSGNFDLQTESSLEKSKGKTKQGAIEQNLHDDEIRILIQVAKTSAKVWSRGSTVRTAVNMTEHRFNHYFSQLTKRGYLQKYQNRSDLFALSLEGRDYLVTRDLI